MSAHRALENGECSPDPAVEAGLLTVLAEQVDASKWCSASFWRGLPKEFFDGLFVDLSRTHGRSIPL